MHKCWLLKGKMLVSLRGSVMTSAMWRCTCIHKVCRKGSRLGNSWHCPRSSTFASALPNKLVDRTTTAYFRTHKILSLPVITLSQLLIFWNTEREMK